MLPCCSTCPQPCHPALPSMPCDPLLVRHAPPAMPKWQSGQLANTWLGGWACRAFQRCWTGLAALWVLSSPAMPRQPCPSSHASPTMPCQSSISCHTIGVSSQACRVQLIVAPAPCMLRPTMQSTGLIGLLDTFTNATQCFKHGAPVVQQTKSCCVKMACYSINGICSRRSTCSTCFRCIKRHA